VSEVTAVTDVDPGEAMRLVEAGALLLDVREDDEWEAGHAPEASHVAVGLVAERLDQLPSDRTLVCVCRVGGRSAAVAGALASVGFDVRNLAGGMIAWEVARLPIVAGSGQAGRIL
jgi:rhodanese-related sulfurtransferase